MSEKPAVVPPVVSSRVVYEGRIINLRVDEIEVAGGRKAVREVVDHKGAVVIAAVDESDQVFLVRQYRHPIGLDLLELPAGTLEQGEDPLVAARRELREEAGLLAAEWTSLGYFYSSPGFLNERLYAFLARNLSPVGAEPDFDEDLTLVRYPLDVLLHRVREITDAKTLATLLLVEQARRTTR